MKKVWEKIRKLNRGKQFQIVFSLLVVLIAFIVVLLNMTGICTMSDSQLLSIIIVLLCSVVIVNVLEEIDVFEEIKSKMIELPDKVEAIERATFEKMKSELTNFQDKMSTIEQQLAEVHKLVKDTHTTKGVIVSRKKLEKSKSLDEVWNGADEVYLLAIANTSFLQGNGISKIKDAVNRGVKFKLVSLNPDYDIINEYDESGIISPTSLPVNGNVNTYIKHCKNSGGKRNGQKKGSKDFKTMVELRLTTYLLPYSMMIVKKNGKINTIKVDLYGLDMEYTDRRSFYIPAEDEDNINFYEEQWNTVWEDSKKTVVVDMSKTY